MEPLAQRLRPRTLDEVCGQQHLLGKNQVFRRTVESGKIPQHDLLRPVRRWQDHRCQHHCSGQRYAAAQAQRHDSLDERHQVGARGHRHTRRVGRHSLYLDEIQYFNKRQQQSLLECVEQGTVTLIASTTENPYFYVYNALLSRCTVFEFKSLTTDDIRTGLRSAAARLGAEDKSPVLIPDDALEYLAQSAGGDMRKALGNLEFAVTAAPVENGSRTITLDMVQQVAVRTAMRYDKLGDDHYDIVSAYQKSMRGSDPDAALHYLGRLLEAGDLPSACRRLMVCACEDVGLAWPQIIPIVKAAVDIANAVGLPEARLPLADAVVLVATAPKSNSAHDGINAAIADIQAGRTGPIPRQLQNKHYDGADAKVKGQHYLYPHDYPNHWTAQQYLPDAIKDRQYYVPGDNKNEQAFAQYWKKNQRRTVIMANLHCEAITFRRRTESTPPPHSSTPYPASLCGLSFSSATACANMCAAMHRWPSSTLPTALRWRATTTSATVTPPRQGSTATTVSRMAVATS